MASELHSSPVHSARAALLALEYPGTRDFDDPSLEWRRLFSELLGTFLLVLVGAGGAVVDAVSARRDQPHGRRDRPGLMVLAIILFMGAISGAHLNPAVTFAFCAARGLPLEARARVHRRPADRRLPRLPLPPGGLRTRRRPRRDLPGPGIHDWQAMLIELVLTAGLLSTILGTASRAQNVGAPRPPSRVGAYIILAGLWSSPISGASMNPARSFGPDIVLGDFSSYWVYLVGPFAGAAIAVGIAFVLRGRGGDVGGLAAARGGLEDDPKPS